MSEVRRKFDEDFKIGAVRIVRETGKPIAQVARDLGINEGTLANWCAKYYSRGFTKGYRSWRSVGDLDRQATT
jgi:transposase-like protein